MTDSTRANDVKSAFREYAETLFLAVLAALVIRSFVLSAYKIPTGSMAPNLLVGDFIFAYKLPFGVRVPFGKTKWITGQMPALGDLVVFRHPQDFSVVYVKRVVGLPGDKVEIRKNQLFINDMPVERRPLEARSTDHIIFEERFSDKSYHVQEYRELDSMDMSPIVVPPGHFFALGDNRYSSDDSRYWGPVPIQNLDGRVVMIWMSLDWEKKSNGIPAIRWNRVLQKPGPDL